MFCYSETTAALGTAVCSPATCAHLVRIQIILCARVYAVMLFKMFYAVFAIARLQLLQGTAVCSRVTWGPYAAAFQQ